MQSNNGYNFFEKLISFILISLMLIVTFATIIFRYFLKIPIMWGEELLRLILLASTFYGCVIAYTKNTHVRIGDFLSTYLPKYDKLISVLQETINIIFLLILTIIGIQVCIRSWNTQTVSLGVSVGIFFCIIPISAILMIFFAIRNIFNQIRLRVNKNYSEITMKRKPGK